MKKLLVSLLIILSIVFFNEDVLASTTYKRGVVQSSGAVRTSASSSASQVKNDTGGSITLTKPEAVEVIGESGNFYQIKFMYSGFIYTGFISKSCLYVKTYTTDDNYENSLINQGFPQDYAKKLAVLHAIHPNWIFTPSFTGKVSGGLDFQTAVQGESKPISLNVIKTSNNSLKSTEDGAYKNGVWLDLAGSGWHAASKQTISFFLDPRNFLDESHIFMFENLGYNPNTQNKDVVNKVLSGSFMVNPFQCGAGAVSCAVGTHYYADTFMSAGIDKKVSPVHLASRVLQEQGSKGSVLSSGNGYNGQYVGYYNFFNIGASGKTEAEVITNGLAYAKRKNWNNQHFSIYDGSSTIASNYIGRGQSNIYYQKFNTIVPSLYINQYQQNVKAPYSEGYSTYTSYYKNYSDVDTWDTAVYDFLIPIYKNMPTSTTLDPSQNGDSTLKSLTVTGCNMSPEFQSSAYTYDCYASKSTTNISITAYSTNANATVSNPGNVTLSSDEQQVQISVKAVNGAVSTYTLNVHRIDTDGYSPTQILNGVGIKVNGNLINNIAFASDVSNIINAIKNNYHFASVTMSEANDSQITSGKVKTGQKITINNAGISNTFNLVVYGDVNGDGLIDIRDLLVIQKHLVGSSKLSGAYLKSCDLNKDGGVDIRDLLLEQKYLLGQYQIGQD